MSTTSEMTTTAIKVTTKPLLPSIANNPYPSTKSIAHLPHFLEVMCFVPRHGAGKPIKH
jgi:hypothetical protein